MCGGCIRFTLARGRGSAAECALLSCPLLSAVITPQCWSVSHLITEGLTGFVRNPYFRPRPSALPALRLVFSLLQTLFLTAPSALILLL